MFEDTLLETALELVFFEETPLEDESNCWEEKILARFDDKSFVDEERKVGVSELEESGFLLSPEHPENANRTDRAISADFGFILLEERNHAKAITPYYKIKV
ncbi:MAG: hypothetical protein K0R90_1405 [Oscillospiraceae bacterium]|nr:hypothetical protein [Oscillospiraceae bacterium]